MSFERFGKTLGKMTPGTLGGQSRSAQPAAGDDPFLRPSSRSKGCGCTRVWVDASGPTSVALVADVAATALANIDVINESQYETSGFSLLDGKLYGPPGLYWFGLSAQFQDQGAMSGTDPVVVNIGGVGGIAASSYSPAPLSIIVPLSGWTTLPFQPTYLVDAAGVTSDRGFNCSLSAYLWRMCDCDPGDVGQG